MIDHLNKTFRVNKKVNEFLNINYKIIVINEILIRTISKEDPNMQKSSIIKLVNMAAINCYSMKFGSHRQLFNQFEFCGENVFQL